MRILVTGANGHLGTNLVSELLGAGHTVRGSVRSLGDAVRTDHLRALGPVELVEADLACSIRHNPLLGGPVATRCASSAG